MTEADKARAERLQSTQCVVTMLLRAGCRRSEIARELGITQDAVLAWERSRAVPNDENYQALVRLGGRYLRDLANFLALYAEIAKQNEGSALHQANIEILGAAASGFQKLAFVVGEGTPNGDQLELELAGTIKRQQLLEGAGQRSREAN